MSDTIIMYENGKAVGGEGHPTNADEITFDNTGTDLVSEEVESAIKEVNAKFDRGSVSVTADGVKTYSQLLNELFALIDHNKINDNSTLAIGITKYHLATNSSPAYYVFTFTDLGYTGSNYNIVVNNAKLWASGSTVYSGIIATGNPTYYDLSSQVPSAGTTIALNY